MYVKTNRLNSIIAYPYTIQQFRAENKNVSLPKNIDDSFLAARFIFPVKLDTIPEHDIHYQYPAKLQRPQFDGTEWKLGWEIRNKTPDHIQRDFLVAKDVLKNEISEARDKAVFKTWNVQVSATTIVPVDVRKDKPDIQNISGLVQAATLKLMSNDVSIIKFRGADDIVYELTPTEIVILGKTIADNYSEMYSKSWTYKDLLEAATTFEEIDSIVLDF